MTKHIFLINHSITRRLATSYLVKRTEKRLLEDFLPEIMKARGQIEILKVLKGKESTIIEFNIQVNCFSEMKKKQ